MKRKIFGLSFALLFVLSIIPNTAQAYNHESTIEEIPSCTYNYYIPPEEMKVILDRTTTELVRTLQARNPSVEYKVEYLDVEHTTAEGYAGGQPSRGTYFDEYGGSFAYTESGGPSVNASVSLGASFPPPFDMISFSVSLGIATASPGDAGYNWNVPDEEGWYKLYIIKHYDVYPYVVYESPRGKDDWSIYAVASYKTEYTNLDHEIHIIDQETGEGTAV